MFRTLRVILPLVLLAVGLLACQAAEKSSRGGTFNAGFPGDIGDFDPDAPRTIMQHGWYAVYDQLLAFNQDLEVEPSLAESWELSPDGLALTLKLRKGIKFHDGTDFDAKAAKFNLDRTLTIEPRASSFGDVEAVEEVQVVDDYTIRLKLKTTSGTLVFGVAEMAGFMVSPAAVEKWGEDYRLHPVGTGAYEFVEWIKGDHYTVKRSKDYWNKDKSGFFDEIIYRTIPDDATRMASFRFVTLPAR